MAVSLDTVLPTAADVDAAARAARRRRLAHAADLLAGARRSSPAARVFLKAETLQRTGSFKFRGAYNKLSSIPAERARRRRGRLFVRQSRAGRGGGGAAARHAGRHRHAVATRRAPSASAPPRSAPRSCSTTASARTARRSRARSRSDAAPSLVPPYDDPLIIAGQGTAGREIVEDLAALGLTPDVVRGHRLRRRAHRRHRARRQGARAAGAASTPPSPQGFDDHARSFRSGRREKQCGAQRHDLRRADGAARRASSPSRSTARWSAHGVAASDEEVAAAVAFAFRELKLVVEPGGAVGAGRAARRQDRCEGQGRGRRSVRRQCRSGTVLPAGGLSRTKAPSSLSAMMCASGSSGGAAGSAALRLTAGGGSVSSKAAGSGVAAISVTMVSTTTALATAGSAAAGFTGAPVEQI